MEDLGGFAIRVEDSTEKDSVLEGITTASRGKRVAIILFLARLATASSARHTKARYFGRSFSLSSRTLSEEANSIVQRPS